MGMINTDKVLIGLGQHISGRTSERCMDCPYFNGDTGFGISCRDELLDDLYELLELRDEAQEPRVMTLEEIDIRIIGKPYIIETYEVGDGSGTFMANGLFFIKQIDGNYRFALVDRHVWLLDKNYGNTWRCWTSIPTEDQRKEARWDG